MDNSDSENNFSKENILDGANSNLDSSEVASQNDVMIGDSNDNDINAEQEARYPLLDNEALNDLIEENGMMGSESDDSSESAIDMDETQDDDEKVAEHIASIQLMLRRNARTDIGELPKTVTKLETPDGCTVYLVGTVHFSTESHEDVAKTIQAVKPDVIVLELCKSRINILQLDEKTVLEESKNFDFEKMRTTIKQNGFVQGLMYIMLLSMSAKVTKSIGMAPGGEFRRAVQESRSVPGCIVHLGDRPIQVTMQRALASLTWYQSFRLLGQLLFNSESVTAEDIEKCKEKDLLEEMLKEMTGDYPALSNVFVNERDIYLTHSLQLAATPVTCHLKNDQQIPTVVVGVVGIGHVPGIINNWNKVNPEDVGPVMIIPKKSRSGKVIKLALKLSFYGLLLWGASKMIPKSVSKKLPDVGLLVSRNITKFVTLDLFKK